MRIPQYLLATAMAYCINASGQQSDQKYFGEIPPGTTPKIFAPGIVSMKDQFEFGAVFSKDGNEFYYSVWANDRAETRVMKFEEGKWTAPTPLLTHDVYSYNDPFLSNDEQRLYFISDRPMNGTGQKKDYDIWYIERRKNGWSEPVNAGPNINSAKNEYYISFAKSGAMYFSSNVNEGSTPDNYDIYKSEYINGAFQPPKKISHAINTLHYEADVFIDPDETYIIFATKRPDGLGSGDLFVSFRNPDGTWTDARPAGATINTDTDDFCPFVTGDGNYLFYASRGDIYWVSMEAIIKSK